MTIDDIRDAAISVEVRLAGHSKRSDGGLNLRFEVHPHGIPQELRDVEIGTRFLLALVQLNDQEEPVVPRRKTKPEHRLATKAALLCKDPLFQAFLRDVWSMPSCTDEASTAEALRTMWGIDSRRELLPGSKAAGHFEHMLTVWTAWKEGPRHGLSMKDLPQFKAPEGFGGELEVAYGTHPAPAKGISE